MTFNEYQIEARKTAIYKQLPEVPSGMAGSIQLAKESAIREIYPYLKLAGETGEICEYVGKSIRDGYQIDKIKLAKELGDILWYLSNIAFDNGIVFEEIAKMNLEKLASRQERGKLHGSGDER